MNSSPKTVCITGTNRGIGLEFVRQYAEAGWEVLACTRKPEATTLQDLKSKYTNVSVWNLDVCEEIQANMMAKQLKDKPIDLLINSAGIFGLEEKDNEADQTFDTVSVEAMCKVYLVDCIGPLVVTRALLNNVLKSQLKTIVTITSREGSISDNKSGGDYAYRPAKAGVNQIMKSLAVDKKDQGLRVLLLSPGWVKTDMGGLDAIIDSETSVKAMRKIIDSQIEKLTIDTDNIFFHYDGNTLTY